ncbi:MAG TPA: hypothetical protein VMT16_13090 [Thermoanaerobaculia bacterium]|nr:hypothetical protein [Thermoanaerobaculia bacterium]
MVTLEAAHDPPPHRTPRHPAPRHPAGRGLAAYVRGRLAWSRGDAGEAERSFSAAAGLARRQQQPDLAVEATFLAALMAAEQRDPSARQRLAQVASLASGLRPWTAFEALTLLAWLEGERGAGDERDRRLAEAAALAPGKIAEAAATLLALRWGDPRTDAVAVAESLPRIPELLGARELILARLALAEGRRGDAARLLDYARSRGLETTYFAEEGWLLERQLGGGAPHTCRPDPPYPNATRFAACWELRDARRPVQPPPASRRPRAPGSARPGGSKGPPGPPHRLVPPSPKLVRSAGPADHRPERLVVAPPMVVIS